MKKIKTVMTSLPTDGGLFKAIIPTGSTRFGSLSARQLGILYFTKSGNKNCSSLVENFLGDDDVISDENSLAIGQIVDVYFGDSWDKIYGALMSEYNPLENYDRNEMSTHGFGETIQTNTAGQNTKQLQYGSQTETSSFGQKKQTTEFGEVTDTKSVGQKTTTSNYGARTQSDDYGQVTDTSNFGATQKTDTLGSKTTTVENKKSAYNSSTYQPDEQTTSDEGSVTNTSSEVAHTDSVAKSAHTDTHSNAAVSDTQTEAAYTDSDVIAEHSDIVTEAQHEDTLSRSAHSDTIVDDGHTDTIRNNAHSDTISSHIHGNIGVTTSQQMLTSEIELRQYHIIDQIMKDVDSLCALKIYSK